MLSIHASVASPFLENVRRNEANPAVPHAWTSLTTWKSLNVLDFTLRSKALGFLPKKSSTVSQVISRTWKPGWRLMADLQSKLDRNTSSKRCRASSLVHLLIVFCNYLISQRFLYLVLPRKSSSTHLTYRRLYRQALVALWRKLSANRTGFVSSITLYW